MTLSQVEEIMGGHGKVLSENGFFSMYEWDDKKDVEVLISPLMKKEKYRIK